jgi:hypothetical protein
VGNAIKSEVAYVSKNMAYVATRVGDKVTTMYVHANDNANTLGYETGAAVERLGTRLKNNFNI